jgi:RND superfamily putative drug exporter
VITAAAIIMSVVFISFAGIDEILVKMIGVGLATAVIVIRVVLAAAVMGLLADGRHLEGRAGSSPVPNRWASPAPTYLAAGGTALPVLARRC